MTDNETNLTLLNVNQIVSLLSRAYIKLIKNGTPLKSFPSVMLWGPPGIGKSQGVREIACNIQAKTGKKVSITDVRRRTAVGAGRCLSDHAGSRYW